MNARGHYGTSQIGQDPHPGVKTALRIIAPSSVFFDPDAYRADPETKAAEEKVWREHPKRTGGILLVTIGAIVAIGVVGAKRGVKFM